MTYDEYQALITSDHKTPRNPELERTNFDRYVEKVLSHGIEVSNLLLSYPEEFSIEKATGWQLDIIGALAGVTREAKYNINNAIELNDDDFRALIRCRIAANTWDGTNEGLEAILKDVFHNYDISFIDAQNMAMQYRINGNSSTGALEFAAFMLSTLRPAGIGVSFKTNYFTPKMILYAGTAMYKRDDATFIVHKEDFTDLDFYIDENENMLLDENGLPLIVE